MRPLVGSVYFIKGLNALNSVIFIRQNRKGRCASASALLLYSFSALKNLT